MPRWPTQAPTQSTLGSREATAIFVREPASRATETISTTPLAISEPPARTACVPDWDGCGKHRRSAGLFFIHFQNIEAHALIEIVSRPAHLLVVRQNRLGPADIHNDFPTVLALDNAGGDFADPVRKFILDPFAFGARQFLIDDILGRWAASRPKSCGLSSNSIMSPRSKSSERALVPQGKSRN